MGEDNLEVLSIQYLDSSWIFFFRELYWEGQLNIWLSKGFVTFKLSDEEKARWRLTEPQIERIEEILRDKVEQHKIKNQRFKESVLQLLASVDSVKIPNFPVKTSMLIKELTQETSDLHEKLSSELISFIPHLRNQDFIRLSTIFDNWKRRNHWPTLKKGAEILENLASERSILIPKLSFNHYQKLPENLPPLLLLLNYYKDPIPTSSSIELYKQLLLLKKEKITATLDFILFVSWRNFPNEMYRLTENWIESNNPILIDWLIHGVEIPGRKEPKRALNFIKPVLNVINDDVEWLMSHVVSQIISASPYESLHILAKWVNNPNISVRAQALLESALDELVNDKIIDKNLVAEDFPDLDKTIRSIMTTWVKNGSDIQYEVANKFLKQ